MVQGVALDYMHGVLEGVTKLLLGLWVEAPQDCLYAVPAKEIDKRMRAKEYRSWLLFYSLPTLHGLLMEEYYQHYGLLVVAIWLLLQSSISQEDINDAEKLLMHFCFKISYLYGTIILGSISTGTSIRRLCAFSQY